MNKQQQDHDILIELKTLLGEVIRRLDDNIRVTNTVQAEIDRMKETSLKENLDTRVTMIEKEHQALPLKEKELGDLVSWGVNFRSRWKLVVSVVGTVAAFAGFIAGILLEAFRVIHP